MAEPPKGTPDIIENPGEFTTDGLFFLRAAQAAIRRECGWHVTPSWTHTIRVDGYGGGTLILPSIRVTDIGGLEFDGIDHADDIDWSEKGTVVLRHGTLPDRPGAIRVTLTDGWEPEDVPELHALMLSLAKRAATAPGADDSLAKHQRQQHQLHHQRRRPNRTPTIRSGKTPARPIPTHVGSTDGMNALDYITKSSNGFSLSGATDFQRLRARRTPRAMNPKQTDEDWQHPDIIELRGALASSTSTRLPDALDMQTTSTAVLTIDNPKADVRIGDRIRAMPDDGRLWRSAASPRTT